MDDEDTTDPFLCLTLDSPTPSDNEEAGSASNSAPKAARDHQSASDFTLVRASYRARIENGEIHHTLTWPLAQPVTKPAYQRVLHAIEELYFYRRFAEARALAEKLLAELDVSDRGLGDDERGQQQQQQGNQEWRMVASGYAERCRRREVRVAKVSVGESANS